MNITLTPQLEEMIRAKIEIGAYTDANEIVLEALGVLGRAEQLERMRAEVKIGLDQIERGETIEYTPDTMARLIRESEENSRLGKPISDFVKP